MLCGYRQFHCMQKTNYIYADITEETRFDTSNYELERSWPKGKIIK